MNENCAEETRYTYLALTLRKNDCNGKSRWIGFGISVTKLKVNKSTLVPEVVEIWVVGCCSSVGNVGRASWER